MMQLAIAFLLALSLLAVIVGWAACRQGALSDQRRLEALGVDDANADELLSE